MHSHAKLYNYLCRMEFSGMRTTLFAYQCLQTKELLKAGSSQQASINPWIKVTFTKRFNSSFHGFIAQTNPSFWIYWSWTGWGNKRFHFRTRAEELELNFNFEKQAYAQSIRVEEFKCKLYKNKSKFYEKIRSLSLFWCTPFCLQVRVLSRSWSTFNWNKYLLSPGTRSTLIETR